MDFLPTEVSIRGVYTPPMLLAGTLGVLGAWLSASLLNRYRLSRFFYSPPLVFVCLAVIYTVVIGTFLIPF